VSVKIPRWYGMPPELFEHGLFAKMSATDSRLCTFLYWNSDRCSSRRFEVPDSDVSLWAGISARALQGARTHLCDFGIITCAKVPGGSYTYELCDPYTGKPYAGDPAEKVLYVKREKQATPNKSILLPKARGRKSKTMVIESSEAAFDETAFDYGFNVGRKELPIETSKISPIDLQEFNPFRVHRREGSAVLIAAVSTTAE
jgi:hypothetical protein